MLYTFRIPEFLLANLTVHIHPLNWVKKWKFGLQNKMIRLLKVVCGRLTMCTLPTFLKIQLGNGGNY